jgi:predicted dehydrogenase
MSLGHPHIAVVGCGYWGSKHVRVLYESRYAEMALAVDARQERLDHIRSEYPGVATSQSFDSVLGSDGIDGVVIATPISTHYDLAKRALLAGKHVLIEKPMATSSEECHELIRLAERRNLTLMVGHTFEYHPCVAFMREYIASGALGDVYYLNSARLNLGLYQQDANVLWDLAPHDLSIIFAMVNQPMNSICTWGCDHVVDGVEDVVHASIRFQNRVHASIHVSWLDPVKVRRLTVAGSEGMIVFDDVAATDKVRIYDKRFNPQPAGDTFADYQSAYHHGDVTIPSISREEPLKLECEDFASAIANGHSPRASGYSGARVVAALEAATRSLNNGGGPIEVAPLLPRDEHVVIPINRSILNLRDVASEGDYAAGG